MIEDESYKIVKTNILQKIHSERRASYVMPSGVKKDQVEAYIQGLEVAASYFEEEERRKKNEQQKKAEKKRIATIRASLALSISALILNLVLLIARLKQ